MTPDRSMRATRPVASAPRKAAVASLRKTSAKANDKDGRKDSWRPVILGLLTSALGLSAPLLVAFALSTWMGSSEPEASQRPATSQTQEAPPERG